MKDNNWHHATDHPPADENCSNGTSVNVLIWHPTLKYDDWVCQGYYHSQAKEWWSWGYGCFSGDDQFLRWRPISNDEQWEEPQDIDWDAVARKWRAGEIFGQAVEVFGSEERTYSWLETPLKALDGLTPDQVLDTDPERVALLLSIE